MTSAESQIAMPFPSAGEQVSEARWLGLATDHRRLFDALQDGWLRPLEPQTGILVGVDRYVAERCPDQEGHPIPVHLELDTAKLPESRVAAFRDGRWEARSIREVESSDTALYWPGVLPAFAIRGIMVSTEEEHARLVGMARFVSNLMLPEEAVRIDPAPGDTSGPEECPSRGASGLAIPGDEDAVHGAMTMAVWAVPRIDPWLDLLTTTLASDRSRLPDLARNVDASWWRFPPWASPSIGTKPRDLQDCLWLAALDTLSIPPAESRPGPRELAERIADAASRHECSIHRDEISAWLASTHGILRAESTIRLDGWRACPVGIAIQLVLTRPDPGRFKTWFQDLPGLPPAIAWSAAALCGLLHGYRRLDAHFRGEPFQRELLSILALRACAEQAREINWPSLSSGEPRWRRDSGSFVLSWGAEEFARRPEKARGRWYAANFEEEATRREALKIARELGWGCVNRELVLRDGRDPLRTSREVRMVRGSDSQPEVEVEVRIPVSERYDLDIEETVDADSFRRLAAVEGIARERLPNPPASPAPGSRVEETGVPGLGYVKDFLTEKEEAELVAVIDRGEWSSELRRRVQHHGWRYDYEARKVDPSMYLGPLPPWADELARRLEEAGLVPRRPDQVIVNEYVGDQGIGAHVDSPSFADGIATISLLESWEMVFREKGAGRRIPQVLERRSVAIMEGDARERWTHEIPHRKTESGSSGKVSRGRRVTLVVCGVVEAGGRSSGKVKRGRRISLTFRKVIAPPGGKGGSG